MSASDIYFVQIDDSRWQVLSRRHPALGPIGWVRRRQVFEGGPIGSPRAKRLWLSLDASRDWFADQLRAVPSQSTAEAWAMGRAPHRGAALDHLASTSSTARRMRIR